MSRYDLLPPNATQLERDFSRAVSSLQRVGPPVPIIRTAKRIDIPDSVVPWLIYEYGLGEILPYLGNDQRLALRDGILWQRIRGTPESVRVALGWIGIEGLIEEPEGGTDRWAEYMLGLDAATEGDEIIDRIVAITRISSPVRSRLQRIYAVYDFRRAVWGEFAWGDGSIYSDHSGVRPRPDWPQISYGRKHSGIVTWDGATLAASSQTQLAGLTKLIDIWRWGEDAWGEGWHVPNRETLLTTTRGVSSQYLNQNWGPFKWREEKWSDVNVVVSSSFVPELWTPAQLQQIYGQNWSWYDALGLTTLSAPGGGVQWIDSSGNNRTLRSSGSFEPTLIVDPVDGLNAILFDGVDDRLETIEDLPSPGPDSITIIAVFKVLTGGSNEDVFMGTRSLSFTPGSFRSLSRQNGQSSLGFNGFINNVPTSSLSLDVGGGYHVFGGWNTALTGADNVRLMRDGTVTTHTTNGPLVKHGTGTKFLIGQLAGGWESNISVREIVVIYAAPTDPILKRIVGYMAHRWVLTANLPPNDPYKNLPPFI